MGQNYARFVSHERKEVCTIEMSCPWIESRAKKDEEKTLKYGPMMWELKQRYNGYRVEQYNVIIDVLGGYSKHLEKSVRKLLGARARSVLERMQKSVISNTLNIARTFIEHELFPPSPPPLSPSLLVYLAFSVVWLTTAITRVLLLGFRSQLLHQLPLPLL